MGIGAITSFLLPSVCASFLLSLVTLNHTKRGEERTCPTLFVRGRIVSRSALTSKGNMTELPLARVSLDGHHVCAHYALARDTQARHGWARTRAGVRATLYLSDCKNFGFSIIYV